MPILSELDFYPALAFVRTQRIKSVNDYSFKI